MRNGFEADGGCQRPRATTGTLMKSSVDTINLRFTFRLLCARHSCPTSRSVCNFPISICTKMLMRLPSARAFPPSKCKWNWKMVPKLPIFSPSQRKFTYRFYACLLSPVPCSSALPISYAATLMLFACKQLFFPEKIIFQLKITNRPFAGRRTYPETILEVPVDCHIVKYTWLLPTNSNRR